MVDADLLGWPAPRADDPFRHLSAHVLLDAIAECGVRESTG